MEKFDKVINFFSELSFDEKEHAYIVNNKKLTHSVSGLIKNFVEEVDFDSISYAIDKNKGFKKGTTRQIWKLKSDHACARGNKAHFFGEVYPFNKNIVAETPLEKAIKSFWDDMPGHIVPVCTELSMYHKEALFGGTADILLYNEETGKYIIADYKTNEELFKNFKGTRLKSPVENLLDTKFNKYQLQFSFYQILLEQIPDIEIENRILIWLKDTGKYEIFLTENLTDVLSDYITETYMQKC